VSDLWLPPQVIQNRGYVEREGEIEELPIPAHVERLLEPGTRRFRVGECTVLISQHPEADPEPKLRGKWHLSISHVERDPTWDEIATARYALVPDHCLMVQVLPPREEYLNMHEHCFHLWEIDADPRFLA
jgi:hypothetical protein